MDEEEAKRENTFSGKAEDKELNSINLTPSSLPAALQSKIVNGLTATLYGIGEVKDVRHNDRIVVVKLPYGIVYCNFESLLEKPEEKIALEMERLLETGKECEAQCKIEAALNFYRKCTKIAPYSIQHFPRIRKLLSQAYVYKAQCLLTVHQYQKASFA